ncbi:hypothetical protein SELMODRAFT_424326 [Selaginella moellendorffii]|uniref:Uncharacterized protein n=1 Tax=Selaginella moellendorffii TaxID=88036 RepID=D8SPI7_SELML|nr:hypothetical protein SELMODRAFT_424326 [Selaginella moellendorffii]
MDATALRAKVAALGLSAVLAYGLFDGITYTTFFVLAFLGYEKSTGQNPAANLKALLGIVVLMWTGNNVTRPFRVAGAAALAPLLDRALKKMQKLLNLPSKAFAFMLVVAAFASLCFSIVGLLILSRWGKKKKKKKKKNKKKRTDRSVSVCNNGYDDNQVTCSTGIAATGKPRRSWPGLGSKLGRCKLALQTRMA